MTDEQQPVEQTEVKTADEAAKDVLKVSADVDNPGDEVTTFAEDDDPQSLSGEEA